MYLFTILNFKIMKKLKFTIAAVLLCMSTGAMAQADWTCKEWVANFEKEIVQLKADIAKLTAESKADKTNKDVLQQLKQKKEDLKVAQTNLKTASVAVKDETTADKEIEKAKAQMSKTNAQRGKAEANVSKAEKAVVKYEQKVQQAEQKVAKAQQKVAEAQQKMEAAKQNVTKAQDNVTKAEDAVAKARAVVDNINSNHSVHSNTIQTIEDRKAHIRAQIKKSLILRADGSSGR